MSRKRKIEIFSAGCPKCEAAIQTVKRITCSSCETEIMDMHQPQVAARAERLGINRLPAIVVDGKLAECCVARGVDEHVLRTAGIGVPLPEAA